MERRGRVGVGAEHGVGLAGVALHGDVRIERDATQERHAHLEAAASPPPFLNTSISLWQCGQVIPLMFSTMPMTGNSLSLTKLTDLRESSSATSCGVVTMMQPVTSPMRSIVVTDSLPVPGGRSTRR